MHAPRYRFRFGYLGTRWTLGRQKQVQRTCHWVGWGWGALRVMHPPKTTEVLSTI